MCFITTCHGQRPCWLKAKDLFRADGQISEPRVFPLDLGHQHDRVAENGNRLAAVRRFRARMLRSQTVISSGWPRGRPGGIPASRRTRPADGVYPAFRRRPANAPYVTLIPAILKIRLVVRICPAGTGYILTDNESAPRQSAPRKSG